jgi:hypothetical protein
MWHESGTGNVRCVTRAVPGSSPERGSRAQRVVYSLLAEFLLVGKCDVSMVFVFPCGRAFSGIRMSPDDRGD